MTRAELDDLVDEHRGARLLYVHRDLGPGFTHHDSHDCPCRPHAIAPDDTRSTDAIVAEIEALERRGNA